MESLTELIKEKMKFVLTEKRESEFKDKLKLMNKFDIWTIKTLF